VTVCFLRYYIAADGRRFTVGQIVDLDAGYAQSLIRARICEEVRLEEYYDPAEEPDGEGGE